MGENVEIKADQRKLSVEIKGHIYCHIVTSK